MMHKLMVMALMVFAALAQVRAADETPWQNHQDMLRTRLVAASGAMADKDGALYAWEAELAPGWKTYWRSPGEAGLPVRLRADGTPIDILYPLPSRFDLFGLETYGYSHKVTLPFRLKADGAAGISADFMVCKDICVPFEATYALPEVPENSANDVRLAAWMARVPAREGDAGVGLSVKSVKLAGTAGHQRLIVDVVANVPLSDADLLAEIDDMVHFGAPDRRLMADGKSARFVLIPITGNKPVDLAGKTVRLTASDGHGHAIDRSLAIGGN